jgi:hypothetical protein
MGYSLNQMGLFEGVIRDPHNRTKKLHSGMKFAITHRDRLMLYEGTLKEGSSERRIFEILGTFSPTGQSGTHPCFKVYPGKSLINV